MALENSDIFRQFSTFEDLESAVKKYSKENLIHLYKRQAITLETAKRRKIRRVPEASSGLIYYEIKYTCVHGGRKFKQNKHSKRLRKTVTMKTGCNFFLQFKLSRDAKFLELSSSHKTHNHVISEELYKINYLERRLPEEMQKEVVELMNMQVNRKMLQAKLNKLTGKTLLLKDFKNMAQKFKHLVNTDSNYTEVPQTASAQSELDTAVGSVATENALVESADGCNEAKDKLMAEDSDLSVLIVENQEYFKKAIAKIESLQSNGKFHSAKKKKVNRSTLSSLASAARKEISKEPGNKSNCDKNAGTQSSSKPELETALENIPEKSNQCLNTTSSATILPNLTTDSNNSMNSQYVANNALPNHLVVNPVNIDQSSLNSKKALTTRQKILLSLGAVQDDFTTITTETADSESAKADKISVPSDNAIVTDSDASAKGNTSKTVPSTKNCTVNSNKTKSLVTLLPKLNNAPAILNSHPVGSTFISFNSLMPIASPNLIPTSLPSNIITTPVMPDTTLTNSEASKSTTKNIQTQIHFVTPSSISTGEISALESIDNNEENLILIDSETLNGGSLIWENAEASIPWEIVPTVKIPEVMKVDRAIQTEKGFDDLTAENSRLQRKRAASPTDDSAVIIKLGGYELKIQTESKQLKLELSDERKENAKQVGEKTLTNLEDKLINQSSRTDRTEIVKEIGDKLRGNKSANIYTMAKTSALHSLHEELEELRFENVELYKELENYRAHDKFYQSLKKSLYDEEF